MKEKEAYSMHEEEKSAMTYKSRKELLYSQLKQAIEEKRADKELQPIIQAIDVR